MLGGATPYATVSSRISQHFKRIFDQVPPRPPILGRVAHEKHTRKYFYYVASAAEQDAFHRKVRAGLIPAQPMPLVPPPSSSRKKPRCMVPAAAVELDHHSPAIESRRSLSRRAVSVEVSEQPQRSTRSRAQPLPPPVPTRVQVESRPRRTSYDGGCVRRASEEEEGGDSNPYARKRYRSVRSAVAQAYPRRRSRAVAAMEEEPEEEDGPAAGKWRRQQSLEAMMDHGEGPGQQVDGGGDLGGMLMDGMFGGGSPTVSPTKDDLAAVVAADLLAPDIDDSVVPLTCAKSITAPNDESPASPPAIFHGHTTTPADLSPRLLSSTGSSVATTAVDYDFSFHDLMDAELMSVNELENLWATSNPADELDDATHAAAAAAAAAEAAMAMAAATAAAASSSTALTTIPETPDEDAAAAAAAATSEGLPSQLTQRLLALSTTTPSSQQALLRAGSSKPAALSLGEASFPGSGVVDSVEPTAALVDNTSDHEEAATTSSVAASEEGGCSSKVILPDPFADIDASAMVATKVAVSPRVVLTIVETVPVYMTVVTTTEPAGAQQGKWLVRRHRLLRLVENGYVNASSLLLAGGVASEQERSIVLSLEVGRFKWRRPQSKLYGTWIPLPRARALAATCSLNHRLGPFLNDNLEAYFPAPLPTSFVRHVITPFFADALPAGGGGAEFQSLVNSVAGAPQSISRSSTFGATARGTPSPSIIQALSTRPPAFSLAAAAKAIFASDDRHLQSFLQLLSADGPMLGTPAAMAAVMAAAAIDEDDDGDSAQLPPPPSPEAVAGVGEEEGGASEGVDAQRLSEAIASTMTLDHAPAEAAECGDDEGGAELADGDGLELLGMAIAGHDADMICSSTPPSPPPPPAASLGRPRAGTTEGGAVRPRAAGLNARLAQSMEAFGLSGAAKASLLLRLRAAAAATSTGRPQAVAPYLLLRREAKRGSARDDAGARKRARVVRVARSRPGDAPAGSAPPPPMPPAPPSKRVADAAAILRVACAIYSQNLNAAALHAPHPPPAAPVARPPPPPPPPVGGASSSPRPPAPPRPVRCGPPRPSPALLRPPRPSSPLPAPRGQQRPASPRPGVSPLRRPPMGMGPLPRPASPLAARPGFPLRRPAAPHSPGRPMRPPLQRPPLLNGQLRPRPPPMSGASPRPPAPRPVPTRPVAQRPLPPPPQQRPPLPPPQSKADKV
ncbi:hypothetical protein FBU31_002368 [Coemansia sp. 'formosensis']|nr:hypothetical protein FBU31_002368 [Coemansia sp. 'formosensis']